MVTAAAEPVFALDPTELDIAVGAPHRQARWTVALRGLLVLPQLVAVLVLAIVGAYVSFMGWIAALVDGRLPGWIAEFEINVIAYSVRVNAYAFMLTDEYPPFSFSPAEYPITVQLGASRLLRLKVFFRWLLVIRPTSLRPSRGVDCSFSARSSGSSRWPSAERRSHCSARPRR